MQDLSEIAAVSFIFSFVKTFSSWLSQHE